jgi:hypothetical protein
LISSRSAAVGKSGRRPWSGVPSETLRKYVRQMEAQIACDVGDRPTTFKDKLRRRGQQLRPVLPWSGH